MTDTNTPSLTDRATTGALNPSLAEGRSRIVLFVGMGGLALGTLFDATPVVWAGLVLILVAFALNTLGKLVHYRNLPISEVEQLVLSLSWLLLAASVLGVLAVFVAARYGPGGGSFFWPLADGSVGFSLLHMAAQGTYLPESEVQDE